MAIEKLSIPFGDTYIKQGDTIPKITFTFDATDNIDLSAVGVEIKMQTYKGYQKVMDFIDEISKDDNIYPYGVLKGDLEILDGNGKRFTYFDVEYTITKEYTK